MDLFNIPFFRSYEAQLGFIMSRLGDLKTSVEEALRSATSAATSAESALQSATEASESAAQSGVSAGEAANSVAYYANLTNQVNQNSARITELESGSTPDADAELLDMRVEWGGLANTSAGNAVRASDGLALEYLPKFFDGAELVSFTTQPGYIGNDGTINTQTPTRREVYIEDYLPLIPGMAYLYVYEAEAGTDSLWLGEALYDANSTFITRTDWHSTPYNYKMTDAVVDGRNLVIGRFTGFPDDDAATRASRKYVRFTYRSYGGTFKLYRYSLPVVDGGTCTPFMLLNGSANNPSPINIDTTNHTIEIPGDTLLMWPDITSRLGYGGGFQLSSNTITLRYDEVPSYTNPSTNTTAIVGIYDGLTDTVRLVAYNNPVIYEGYTAVLFTLRWNANNDLIQFNTSAQYTVNNNAYGIVVPEALAEASTWRYNPIVKSINHRGYNTVAPENTLPAFKMSKKMGFDIVECDLQLTSDGVPVVIHDQLINRTARNSDGSELTSNVSINNITYAQALTYDFGIWKGSAYAGTKIPTFEEFLKCCRDTGLDAYVELKTESSWTATKTAELDQMIKEAGMKDHVTFISFGVDPLVNVHSVNPDYRLGYVAGTGTSSMIDTIKAVSNNAFIDVSEVDATVIEYAVANNIGIERWTVDTVSDLIGDDVYISGYTSNQMIAAQALYMNN